MSRCPFLGALSWTTAAVGMVNPHAFAQQTADPTVITHRFLAAGSATRIIEADGHASWSYPESTRDAQMLSNGHLLLTLSASEKRPHGAVIEIAPSNTNGGVTVFTFTGTQSEINTAQRLDNGNTLVVEAGASPRILEVNAKGDIVIEVALKCQSDNHHMESRMTRKLPNGNYLVPQLLDRVVREYTAKGEIVWEYKTPDEPKDAWPFTVIRLDNGNTLITCTHGNLVVEVNAKKEIVWQLSNADFPIALLNDPCGAQRLPNGNTVICSYAIGEAGTKLFEVTREKKVVWTFLEKIGPGIHEVEILDSNGQPLTPKSADGTAAPRAMR